MNTREADEFFQKALECYSSGRLSACCDLLIIAQNAGQEQAKRFLAELAASPEKTVRDTVEQSFRKAGNTDPAIIVKDLFEQRTASEASDVSEEALGRELRKRADGGDPRAQYEFGSLCLESGNLPLGKKYLKLAARQGFSKADELLQKASVRKEENPSGDNQPGPISIPGCLGTVLSLTLLILLGFYFGGCRGGIPAVLLMGCVMCLFWRNKSLPGLLLLFFGHGILLFYYGTWRGLLLSLAAQICLIVSICTAGEEDTETGKTGSDTEKT